jgi:molybdopterin-guanine dinucleotide biosynthesis protein A
MGSDKSGIEIDGVTLAVRTADLLLRVVETAVEVGPGVSGLPATLERPPGGGPLVAIAAGHRALRQRGHKGAALVIACDLPFISERLLRFLAEWDSPGSVVPVVNEQPQPLLARWGQVDLENIRSFIEQGARSLRHLATQPGAVLLDQSRWELVAQEREFSDVDCPGDLRRLGLSSSE